MKKKAYEKPSMKVIKLQHCNMLLYVSGYPGEVYAPGQPTDDMNQLA